MATEAELFRKYGREFPSGSVVFREGDPAEDIYVVHQGRVRITRRQRGLEKVLDVVGPGDFFGEVAMLSGREHAATATVVEDARLIVIGRPTFEAMVRGNLEIAVRMLRKLAHRLDRAHRQVATLLFREPAARVADALLDLAGRREGGTAEVPDATEVAADLGLSPGEVRSVLERMEGAGLLRREGARLVVADPTEVRRFMEFLDLRERYAGL